VGLSVTGGGPDNERFTPVLSLTALHGPTQMIWAIGSSGNTAFDVDDDGAMFVFGELFAFNHTGPSILHLDPLGNLTISGKIFTAGQCAQGCSRTAGGRERRVVTYGAQHTVPTVEDFGEGKVLEGKGYVRIDSAFANVIDSQASYMVFITPEGDNRGLFVTGKTAQGFTVRESQGGRSTLDFSYRIVAKPYGDASPKLPAVELKPAVRRR
jgi:hypothetical protein